MVDLSPLLSDPSDQPPDRSICPPLDGLFAGEAQHALVIVDVQRGFVRNGTTDHIPGMIAGLLGQHGCRFSKIFLTQFVNSPSSNFHKLLRWREMTKAPQTDLHPVVLAAASELNYQVIEKHTYGCLGLASHLYNEGISSALVCGIDTEACVMNIATGLFDHGIKVRVWSDGCASTAGSQMHLNALDIMRRTLGDAQIVSYSS